MHKQNCPTAYGCLVIHENGICPEQQKPCTCYGNVGVGITCQTLVQ